MVAIRDTITLTIKKKKWKEGTGGEIKNNGRTNEKKKKGEGKIRMRREWMGERCWESKD